MLSFSIIICTYNRCKLLRETIISVLSITENKLDCEIIVIDNNSTDDTENVVNGFLQVKYIKELNQGLSYARNRGIDESSKEILAFLDDDVELEANYFDVLDSLYADPQITVVGGKVLPYKTNIPEWLAPEYYYLASVFDIGNKRQIVKKLMGANYTMRKEVALAVGYYNTELGRKGNILAGGEEIDYLNRARDLEFKLTYEPKLVVYHKINEKLNERYLLIYSYEHGKSEVIVDFNRNKIRFLLKILKSFLVNGSFKISHNKKFSAKIKNQYFSGYRSSALAKLPKLRS